MHKEDKDITEKKISKMSIRLTSKLRQNLLAESHMKGIALSSVVTEILDNYFNKDIDTKQQLLASNSVLHSDLRKQKAELTMLQNALYALTYSFFIANGEKCVVEFAEGKKSPINGKEIPQDVRYRSAEMRLLADTLMQLWKNKMRSNPNVVSAIMQDAAELFNPETKK